MKRERKGARCEAPCSAVWPQVVFTNGRLKSQGRSCRRRTGPRRPLEGSSSTFTERERRGQSAFRNLLRARLSPPPSSPVRRARSSSGCSLFMIEHFLGYTFLQLNTVPELFTTCLSLSADQTYAPNQTLSVETANISPRDSEYKTCA